MNRRRFLFGALGAAAAAAAGGAVGLDRWLTDTASSKAVRVRRARRPLPTTTSQPGSIVPADGIHAEWVARENAKPGSDAWRLTGIGESGAMEGYGSSTSATQGDTVTLYVSTRAHTFHVEA